MRTVEMLGMLAQELKCLMSQCLVVDHNKIETRCDFMTTLKVVLKYYQYTLMSVIVDWTIANVE